MKVAEVQQLFSSSQSGHEKIIKFLNNAPTNEVYTKKELALKIGCTINGRLSKAIAQVPDGYKLKVRLPKQTNAMLLFGHPLAIEALREKVV